jgi:hypothetical protein
MIGVLTVALFRFPAAASDVFVVSQLDAQAGYEGNRLGAPGSGEGSPFWQVSPGFDMTVFAAKTEASLLLDYRRTQYTESGFEFKDEASVLARWRYFGGQNEAGASVGGGLYRDQAWPTDDYTFWQAMPYFVRTIEGFPVEVSLKWTFLQTFYDVSVYTSAADRVDDRIEVRPGLRWHFSHRVTVWADLYAERNMSDAAEVEYSGFGGAMGCEFRPATRLDLGAWAGIGTRTYVQSAAGADRRDTPMPMGAWATYRLRPWLELFFSVDREFYASTIDDNEYSWWRVGGGLKLVSEHEVAMK